MSYDVFCKKVADEITANANEMKMNFGRYVARLLIFVRTSSARVPWSWLERGSGKMGFLLLNARICSTTHKKTEAASDVCACMT